MQVALNAAARPLSIVQWLDALNAVMPARAALLVGAGTGTGAIVQWLLSHGPDATCLVEGDERQYRHLARHVPARPGWTLRRDVVAGETSHVTFHRASNAGESGLVAPDALRALWPNLVEEDACRDEAAVTLDMLARDLHAPPNWVVLDCLPAGLLIRGGDEMLPRVDVVVARVVLEGAPDLLTDGALRAVGDALTKHGLRLAACVAERHPALGVAVFVRDVQSLTDQLGSVKASLHAEVRSREAETKAKTEALAEGMRLAQERDRLKAALADGNQAREAEAKAKEEAVAEGARLAEERDRLKAALAAETQARDTEAKARGDAIARGEKLAEERERLTAALDAATKACKAEATARAEVAANCELVAKERDRLLKLIEDGESRTENLRKGLEASVTREIANAVRQIEAFTNLQGYLTSGELMPPFHGWPISPDFALLVVQMLHDHSFDAVIEFGSGSSTLLIARTLENLSRRFPQRKRPLQIAFEHLDEYHDATTKLLSGAGLLERVDLVLAPLKRQLLESGETATYYDLGNTFATTKVRLGNLGTPRILAIVDGPPETTGPLARYPALEMLLQGFGQQFGSVLIDDYRRPGERETVRRWQEFLSSKGIPAKTIEYELEKMACLVCFDSSASNFGRQNL